MLYSKEQDAHFHLDEAEEEQEVCCCDLGWVATQRTSRPGGEERGVCLGGGKGFEVDFQLPVPWKAWQSFDCRPGSVDILKKMG